MREETYRKDKVEKQKMIKLLQTILFLQDDVPEHKIMLNYGLGDQLNKAKRVKRYIEND